MSDDASRTKLVINYSELTLKEQDYCIELGYNALKLQEKTIDKQVYCKDLAEYIKKELDQAKGGTWNVIVGKSFGSFVSHEMKNIIHFSIGNVSFLYWKHG